MKTKIKKAEMRGQFIDMQPTRGGIPARLKQAGMRRVDIERIGIPYVVGRIGWIKSKNPQPIDVVFCHCTDYKKASDYRECLTSLNIAKRYELRSTEKEQFKLLTEKWNFKYPQKHKKLVENILA